ncbi:6483_t:CDS:2 [Acaulospora morrowiae]|uniref:6483_t:CDS:1 n=1 Tax=Acaulospora morrowiae TaxID=94023 RepID=A0A9N8Z2C9_9GLOM|nr:6483_t:CDS:2 [Acaulospora morrowiae]
MKSTEKEHMRQIIFCDSSIKKPGKIMCVEHNLTSEYKKSQSSIISSMAPTNKNEIQKSWKYFTSTNSSSQEKRSFKQDRCPRFESLKLYSQ